ncbi:MAG: flagellar motor switch protein FliG [Rhizobiales bacterium]|jgi:flagellar motor switch protein FliG|nr:flagellar motor switch protein FliG [Hyphomicrobiales bacterium]
MNAAPAPGAKTKKAPAMHNGRPLTGVERAAVMMLALGQEHGEGVWKILEDDEIRELSIAISRLGTIDSNLVDQLLVDFVGQLSGYGGLLGNTSATERLLTQFLSGDRVNAIMEEIRGPAGRNMWEKLSNVQEDVLANYLKNEYPQTIAVVLSKIRAEQAARVLSVLPEPLALDVINRLIKMEAVQKDVLERVEQTLRMEFMSTLAQTSKRDPYAPIAEIFNFFDRQTESRFFAAMESTEKESAERIKTLMFTFDDLVKLDSGAIQTILRKVDKAKLTIALKGATETVREYFLKNMSQRAAKMMIEEMQNMGPVRLRDVDEAQALMITTAKDLADKGEIVIVKGANSEDELVY